MTAAAAIALCLALPLPLVSPNVALLSLSLVVLGACNATLDVSMNAQAVAVERVGHAAEAELVERAHSSHPSRGWIA